MLGEHGFVGLGLFLTLGLLSLRASGQVIRRTRDREDLGWANSLARMLQASLVAYATGGLFLGLAYWDLYYHLVVLVVMLREHVNGVLSGANAADAKTDPSPQEADAPDAQALLPGDANRTTPSSRQA